MNKFILASASPRRRELLENIGLKFDILVSSADESGIDRSIPAEMLVKELALLKAMESAKHAKDDAYIIGADTVVALEGKILEKPKDKAHAKEMLKSLSGKSHQVFTGVCVIKSRSGEAYARCEKTTVNFKELSDDMIDAYVATGEPMDKAGAYGIQGIGSLLIKGIEGDYFNVVGLPVSLLSDIFSEEFGVKLLG